MVCEVDLTTELWLEEAINRTSRWLLRLLFSVWTCANAVKTLFRALSYTLMAVLSMSMRNIILQYVLQMCVLLLAGCSRCWENTKRGKTPCCPLIQILHALLWYLSPTCLAMSSELKQSSAKSRIVLACFISGVYHISRWNTTAGKRYCQGSKETIEWALMIYRYISAIIPTQAEVTESRL